jgi:uroporphyrinogen decarboxylase
MDHIELMREIRRYKDKMTQEERLKAYWEGKEVDRLPVALSVREGMAPLYGFTPGGYRRDFNIRAGVYEHASRDFSCWGISIGPNLKGIGIALGAKAVYPEGESVYLKSYPLSDIRASDSLEPPDPYSSPVLREMMDDMGRYRHRFGKKCPLSTDIAGPFSTAASIMPLEALLVETLERPEKLRVLLELSLESVLRWVRAVNEEYGVVSVNVADPVASLSVVGLRIFEEQAAPFLLRMRKEVERITGKKPGLHICGKTASVWEKLAQMEYASFRVDNCEELGELKAAVGGRMAIAGNVPPVEVMLNGTLDEVVASAKECIRQGADSPCGYTLAAGCQLPPGVSADHLHALLLAARKYGRFARIGQAAADV